MKNSRFFSIRRHPVTLMAAMVFGLVGVTTNSHALIITTNAGGTGVATDTQTASSGTVTSSVTTSTGDASATQSAGGTSAASARGISANGTPVPDTAAADASWKEMFTNNSLGALSYSYVFSVGNIQLRLQDFAGISDLDPNNPHMNARYSADVLLNGASIFNSSATLAGGRVHHTLSEAGQDLGGTLVGNANSGFFGYDFAGGAFTLPLGTFNSGDSFTIEAKISADVDYPGFETGASAQFGDPNNLAQLFGLQGIVSTGPAAIPEPTTLLLFVGGIILLGLGRCGRKNYNGRSLTSQTSRAMKVN